LPTAHYAFDLLLNVLAVQVVRKDLVVARQIRWNLANQVSLDPKFTDQAACGMRLRKKADGKKRESNDEIRIFEFKFSESFGKSNFLRSLRKTIAASILLGAATINT